MYSREFSDKRPHLPPRYGGTAFTEGEREREHTEGGHGECKSPEPPKGDGECAYPPPRRGLLDGLLPFELKGDDLLLLGLALLLLNDGCEDEYLPLLLLFLLIVH